MTRNLIMLLGALSFTLTVPTQAETTLHSPKPGDAERKAILDALRVPVQRELKQPVLFKVDHIAVKDGWAFVRGTPQQPDASPINYTKTRYQEAIDVGMFDGTFSALLRFRDASWRVVTYNIGATDVIWTDWDRRHKAPSEIFR